MKSYSSSLSVSLTTPFFDIFDLFSFSSLSFPFAFTISFLTARSSASTELSLLRSKQNLIKPQPTWECIVKKQGVSHFQGSTWREEGNLFLPSRSRLRIVTVPSRILPSGGPCKTPGISHYIPSSMSGSLFSAAWTYTSKRRLSGYDFLTTLKSFSKETQTKSVMSSPAPPPTPAPPAAEAIALLAAPELPPPPRALRGACFEKVNNHQVNHYRN